MAARAFPTASGTAAKKVAAGREAGKSRKRGGKKCLTGDGNNCIFCNKRKNRRDERGKKDRKTGREKKRENKKKNLTPLAQKFILQLGEMGHRWGIKRTGAQESA